MLDAWQAVFLLNKGEVALMKNMDMWSAEHRRKWLSIFWLRMCLFFVSLCLSSILLYTDWLNECSGPAWGVAILAALVSFVCLLVNRRIEDKEGSGARS